MFEQYISLFWLIVIFVLVFAVTFSLIYRLSGYQRTRERLQTPRLGDPERTGRSELVLGEMTPGLAAQMPMREEARSELQRELMAAGFYRKNAVTEYAAIRTVLIVLPLIVAGIVALLVETSQITTVIVLGLLTAGLGYSLPRIYLYVRARMRAQQIERGLPVAVDMLTLCLTAGQNLLAALERVGLELRRSHRVLAEEFDIVRQQAQLGTLQHAMQSFADRVQVPEVRNLAMILIQSERLGTDVGSTLLEYSANLRTTLRQRADAKANRTMFWMLFPTLLCLWIPAGIVLIGPAVLEFNDYRQGVLQQWRDARKEMLELQKAAPATPQPLPPATPQTPAGDATGSP